jgi:hypothetical protein
MKSYIINLHRRKDRLIKFWNNFPQDWPYDLPVVYKAIAGKYCNPPSWWNQGGGAWGCYKSHLNIIEQELNQDSKQNILIFEDDAMFCQNFIEKMEQFLSIIPDNADQIYLGGQHLTPPTDINLDNCYLANNINRTHCYIVTPKGLPILYKHLNETINWDKKFHIDHHYGYGHSTKKIIAYSPKIWLIGQDEDDKSDICEKPVKKRWWHNDHNKVVKKPQTQPIANEKFVVVLGLHRSGSSCIAMILHKLGINMGDNLGGYEGRNGGGGEAQRLAQICEQAAIFPSTTINIPKEVLEKKLKDWITERMVKARRQNTIAGGKYPHLCAFGDQLINILSDNIRIIHCDRPIEESIDSLKRRSKNCKGWLNITDEQAEKVQSWLWENKNNLLSKIRPEYVLNLNYKKLLEDPQSEIDNIIRFLNINPTNEQRHSAIKHVKNSLLR